MKLGKMVGIAVFVLCVPAFQGCVGVAATGTAAGRCDPGSTFQPRLVVTHQSTEGGAAIHATRPWRTRPSA